MNILLVVAPRMPALTMQSTLWLPVSLLYLAAVLREAGHAPTILDLAAVRVPEGVQPEEHYRTLLLDKIRELDPGYIGISCRATMDFPQIRQLARVIHEEVPNTPICLGGAHPTWHCREILEHCPEIDCIVLGEGEPQVVALAEAIAAGDRRAYANIESFAYVDKESGSIMVNPRKSYIQDLDTWPFPAYDLVDFSNYHSNFSTWHNPKGHQINMRAPILTSRSCPFNCSFCMGHSMSGRGFRPRSPAEVVRELEFLVREFGQNFFCFYDENCLLHKDRFIAICDGIYKTGFDIQLSAPVGFYLNAVDEDIVKAFVRAGGCAVGVPIETGSSYLRNKIIEKKISDDTIKHVVKLYKKYDLFTYGAFIMGFEEDTPATLDETIAMIHELQLDVNDVFNLVPYPGTRIHAQAKRNGTLLIDDSQAWKGEVILGSRGGAQQFFIQPPGLSMEELRQYRAKFDQLRLYSDRARNLNRQGQKQSR
ncbi:B12-binding domain-containing radical SAM protein [Megalodesulfovibrio gigas]|uniref:Putative Magnesium-protoporphyrin IX monomethyl ester anaerobic oxidative cyclase n=1 Tax=Megalodesulfovibrio gigas (strain ATCC 19364 / DSM 1382 / NCIMB 9332 / VKM B-1759) TaxID=1121448 RepID=T2GFP5_MEGG1|nr:radical SAM protein [Megalodesulfovibrio gigas]AGW15019.1 putative Magnesium-protoporphyrin IX monomethyl ester anaerobic oxidative cyclase [Megalodesulfovibrio gigas DSM 1382 = ATCC 19364]